MKSLQLVERFSGGPQTLINDPLQTLSKQQSRALRQDLDYLAEQCPDYSFLELSFSMNEYAQVTVKLQIDSLKLQFHRQRTSPNAIESWRKLKIEALQEITDWKAQRFMPHLPPDKNWSSPIAS